ncbi:hypothetical protein CsSME_00046112 [Camellia sinensis var. sinensis]
MRLQDDATILRLLRQVFASSKEETVLDNGFELDVL